MYCVVFVDECECCVSFLVLCCILTAVWLSCWCWDLRCFECGIPLPWVLRRFDCNVVLQVCGWHAGDSGRAWTTLPCHHEGTVYKAAWCWQVLVWEYWQHVSPISSNGGVLVTVVMILGDGGVLMRLWYMISYGVLPIVTAINHSSFVLENIHSFHKKKPLANWNLQ